MEKAQFANSIILAGNHSYSIENYQGCGSFGEVVKATSEEANKIYALKLVDKTNLNSDDGVTNTKDEFETLQHLRPLNTSDNDPDNHIKERIIKSFCYEEHTKLISNQEETDQYEMLVLEYLRNGNLFELQQLGQLKPNIAKFYFKSLIEALEYCHKRKVIHRDIKANNIMLSDDFKNIVLIDFGISLRCDPSSMLENYMYRTRFRPPEFYDEQDSYQAAHLDIFACGILLFQLGLESYPFNRACKKDDHYCKFKKEGIDAYWQQFKPFSENDEKYLFDKDFKSLVTAMIHPNPALRPTIEQIKQSPWLADAPNLDEQAIIDYIRNEKVKQEQENKENEARILAEKDIIKLPVRSGGNISNTLDVLYDKYLLSEDRNLEIDLKGSKHNLTSICCEFEPKFLFDALILSVYLEEIYDLQVDAKLYENKMTIKSLEEENNLEFKIIIDSDGKKRWVTFKRKKGDIIDFNIAVKTIKLKFWEMLAEM